MRVKTTILKQGKKETDAAFRKRYQDKAIELDYVSYTVRKDSVTINH